MNRYYIRLLLIIFICSISYSVSQPLDTNALKPKFGVYGNYGLSIHFADFRKIPNTNSCCIGFGNEIGPVYSIGGIVDIPINYDYILSFRAGYGGFSGNFYSEDNTTVIVDRQERQGVFSYNLNSDFTRIDLDALLSYRLTNNIFLNGGLNFAYLISTDYEQWEQIEEPSDRGVFPGKGRVQNYYEGEIEDANDFQVGVTVGADYQLPLNNNNSLFLVPGLYYTQKFLPVVNGLSWNLGEFKANIAVKYRKPPPPPPPPPPPADPLMPDSLPPPIEPPVVEAFVDAVAIDSTGKVEKEPNIKIEDFVSLNMRPLLNYIFFDDSSSAIPDRYNLLERKETIDFSFKKLKNKNALETYYDVLNIIGNRLKANLSANITLVGCNSDIGAEENNIELSRDRAERVKKYFTNVWNISSDRIEVEARNLPSDPSKSDTIPGQAENRRVEIWSDDESIIQPVITNDTLRVISDKDIKFFAKGESEVGIDNWQFEAVQNGSKLFEKSGEGNPDEEMMWELRNKAENMPRSSEPIKYTLHVEDSLGQSGKATKEIPIDKLTVDKKRLNREDDKEFEYYSLILFSYGKSSLKREHREVVDLVKGRITDNAKVYIRGYSDSMGDEEINKKISERRARSVANRMRLRDAEVEGLGEENLLYDNSLPEGRFYCRTVEITVETPVKDNNLKDG